jgi:transcriptional regulator with XRE-family HTH domain
MTNNRRVIREDRNLTQTEVCEIMRGVDDSFDVPMLSKMENGICLPTPYQLLKLAELYKCLPSDLVKADLYW